MKFEAAANEEEEGVKKWAQFPKLDFWRQSKHFWQSQDLWGQFCLAVIPPSASFTQQNESCCTSQFFLGLKHTGNFTTKKNPFCFLFICDGVPAAMVFCVVEKAKATATFGMPVSTSQYSQYLQIVLISIRQKKRSDSTSTQRGKVGCATISHFDSPWKSVKRSKEFLKLAYLDFYWRSKKKDGRKSRKREKLKTEKSRIQLCIET